MIDQVSHPGVLYHYVMCVDFILECSLLFFMQHKVLEVTYLFPYFCTLCMYVSVLFSNGPWMLFFNQRCYELLSEMDG